MIEFVQKSGKTDLVLFVHGFTGGRDTWRHEVDGFLNDHLLENAALREGYDIAVFEYYSTLVNLFPVADSIRQKIVSLFKSIQTKTKKNISIYEISNLLTARIRFDLENYQNIVVIAHSMGGLITKSYVLQELEAGRNCKVKVILSLAVPHLGADLATYGKLLSNNQQIEDLAPLSELCPKLNDAWVKCDNKPIIKYFYGAYDTVVTKQSAIGTDNLEQDIISCDDTHLTICKPPKNGLLVTAITKFLIDFKSHSTPFALQRVSDSEQYDDERRCVSAFLRHPDNRGAVVDAAVHFVKAHVACVERCGGFDVATEQRDVRTGGFHREWPQGCAHVGSECNEIPKTGPASANVMPVTTTIDSRFSAKPTFAM